MSRNQMETDYFLRGEVRVSATDAMIADASAFERYLHCVMWLSGLLERPPTPDEDVAGRQTYQHDDHEHVISIGWRREQERVDAEARDQAEMAACPHVACTCGHHE